MYQRFVLSVLFMFVLTASLLSQSAETRTPGAFSKINVAGGFDEIILKPGDSEKVDITASGVELKDIETDIKNNALNIQMRKGWNGWNKKTKIQIVVTYRSIEEVNNAGSTDIKTNGAIKAPRFEYNASGSGDLVAEIEADKLKINISGSADLQLKGSSAAQTYAISGSGNIDASALPGENASVAISGSGDVTLNISGKVRTAISGSGDVNNVRK